jgi:Tfp pilus assembly protein PilF
MRCAKQQVALALALTLAACSSAPSTPQAKPAAKVAQQREGCESGEACPLRSASTCSRTRAASPSSEEVRVGNDIHADYDAAMRFFEQKQYEQGIASLVRVTQAAPNVTAAHIDLGIAYERIGDLDKAEASLMRRPRAQPASPDRLQRAGHGPASQGSVQCRAHELREGAGAVAGLPLRTP